MSSSDCGPLQEMRKDLSGDCCAWAGVTCDRSIGNRVTYVGWSGVRLTGTIPPSIGGLTNLTELNLSSNQLTGSIPPTLGNLKNLRTLDLDANKLTGAIPDELGGLSSVTWMDLSNNGLTGRIPESLSQLPKLSVLYVYHNSLSGPLTKLPNPGGGCYMLSTFNESNDWGCLPQGASGKCAADLAANKLPECDANGNPPPRTTTTRGSLSPGLGSVPTSGSSSGSNTSTDSSSSSFPIMAVTLPGAIMFGSFFAWFLVVYFRRQQAQHIANHRVPITITMPNGNTATVQVGAGATGATATTTQQQSHPTPIPMPKPTLVSPIPTTQSPATPTNGADGGGDWQYVKINTIRVEQPVGDETMRRPLPALPTPPALQSSGAQDDDEELYLPPPMPGPRPEDDQELVLPGNKPVAMAKDD